MVAVQEQEWEHLVYSTWTSTYFSLLFVKLYKIMFWTEKTARKDLNNMIAVKDDNLEGCF